MFTGRAALALVVLSCALSAEMASALPTFANVALEVGLTARSRSSGANTGIEIAAGGATVGDFDRDGWQDIFFPRLDNTPILYRNVPHPTIAGQRSFVDVTPASMKISGVKMNGAVFGDLNNDGYLDLYATSIMNNRYYLFMNNGAGGFTEEATARGASLQVSSGTLEGTSAAVGDYNRDGFLDVVTTEWGGTQGGTRLLRNRGATQPGYFQDMTTMAGVVQSFTDEHVGYTASFVDVNRDGWQDLFVAGDFMTSRVMWNSGNGTFADGTASSGVGAAQARNPMGSTFGDYDRDGDLDWFITSTPDTNVLYRNNNNSTFTEVAAGAGVQLGGGWGWGASFFDYDNDGWLDLAMTNGWVDRRDTSVLWRNNGNGTFSLVSPGNGIADTKEGRTLLTFDYDNDGDLDVFTTNYASTPMLYRNNGGNSNNWLKIRTIGTLSNRDGIGALITVQPDLNSSAKMIWEVGGGSNYLGQSEMNAFFGLGSRPIVDLITIVWPSGQSQTLTNVSANQFLSVTEVPEPAGLVLGGLAAAGLLLRRRRNRS